MLFWGNIFLVSHFMCLQCFVVLFPLSFAQPCLFLFLHLYFVFSILEFIFVISFVYLYVYLLCLFKKNFIRQNLNWNGEESVFVSLQFSWNHIFFYLFFFHFLFQLFLCYYFAHIYIIALFRFLLVSLNLNEIQSNFLLLLFLLFC